MAFKTVTYKILGMKQDTSESAFDSKYAYENRNIRIDARNNNTLLSIENERGNTQITSIKVWSNLWASPDLPYSVLQETINTLPFVVIGQVVIDNYLVLFGKRNNTYDVIARLEYISSGLRSGWNMVYFYNDRGLNFNINNPIEAIPNVETEKIKKVYWVDGLNVPRTVNIVNEAYINNPTIYNLTSTLALKEQFIVAKDLAQQGYFKQGKVQYCFTYFNDTDTESNIVEMSPMFDITKFDNGISQTDASINTNGVFNIQITNLDTAFKYVKIYCLNYTGLSSLPEVSSLPKITIPQSVGASIHLIDTGKGHIEESAIFATDSISSKQSFVPATIGVKDNTLFFGNIKILKPTVENFTFNFGTVSEYLKPIGVENTSNSVYQYRPSLTTFKGSNYDYKGFKKHNWYKLGFIAQYYSGEWSDVIYLGDYQCSISSETTINGDQIVPKIPNFRYTFSTEDYNTLQNLYDRGYRKIKPVCVVPNEIDRTVIAQGILSPTLYVGGNRLTPSTKPFAQSSWFFRPALVQSALNYSNNVYTPEYSYTLRDKLDFLSLDSVYTSSQWWKPDINSSVTLNRNYREFRHGFALPPKDRINAELESSDAMLNAYFIYNTNGINLFADKDMVIGFGQNINPLLTTTDAAFLGRQVTPGTDNITYDSSRKVLLHDKTYSITGFQNTVFIDESIITFNSPDIDFANTIGYNAAIDITGTDIYLNNVGAAQITSSYSMTDIVGSVMPTNVESEYKLFENNESNGKCIYNLTGNTDLDEILNIIKFNNANNGYNPILAGPWWYEWVYALGFVKTSGSDDLCIEPPIEINHALAIGQQTVNDHYVLRTATGISSTNFKQSWSGQLYNSGGTDRLTIGYSTGSLPTQYFLYYGNDEDRAPLATHNFLAKYQGSFENYPNTTDCGSKPHACAAWMAYGLASSVRQYPLGWFFTYVFGLATPASYLTYLGFDHNDNWNRSLLYRPFGYDSYHRKGFSPVNSFNTLGSDIDSTVVSPYGGHIYSNSETSFPHTAFEKRYPHVIYPFMTNGQALNGNTSLYKSPKLPVPSVKRVTNLLYSKNTIYYSTLTNTGVRLESNVNPSNYVFDDFARILNYDWLEDVFTNFSVTYKGSFKANSVLTHKTHHLIPALKWYRGFNSLSNSPIANLAGIAKVMNLTTFTEDVLFAGWFKPLYKKSGYMQNMSLDFDAAFDVGTLEYSDEHSESNNFNVLYDNPTTSIIQLNYLSTPHIVSSYRLSNGHIQLLPKISVDSVPNTTINYNDAYCLWESSYYCKEFLKHTPPASSIAVNEDNAATMLTSFIRQSIYPHTGCWAKIYPDHAYTIHVDGSGNTYPFWAKDFDDAYHYPIAQDGVVLQDIQILPQDNSGKVDMNKVGVLHIGEYIKINNFHESPYDSTNVQLYDWLPCGNSYQIEELLDSLNSPGARSAEINFLEGDIYFQRYNCLKTSGKVPDNREFNAIVEHASVYLETYINIDGRYDQHNYIDNIDNIQDYDQTVYTDSLNEVYSRKNDFITYKQIDYNLYNSNTYHFPTAIMWSLTKIYGEVIDSWSVIPAESIFNVDGVCGEITALRAVGNNLLCFQQKGLSMLDFNSKALIQTDTLSPISISTQNSVKMQGVAYISKQTGTFNKHSIINTPNGLCFVDNDKQSILRIGNDYSLSNLSDLNGMTVFTRSNMTSTTPWSPLSFISDINNAFTGYYDSVHHDLYFTNNQHCLVFNEALGAFTSFYSYEKVPYMINYKDKLIATFYSTTNSNESSLWIQHSGDYKTIFGVRQLVNSIEVLVNENAIYDKVFNFAEFYYDCFKQDTSRPGNPYTLLSTDPAGFPTNQIYSISSKNEYQSGVTYVNSLSLRQKFRLWRMEIPRDSTHKLDRMRSPWLFIKLTLHNQLGLRQLLHTLSVNYTLTNQPLKEN